MENTEAQIAKILVIQEVTAKNVEILTIDLKRVVDTLPQFARVDEKYKSIEERVIRLEAMWSWVIKIIVGAVLTAIVSLVIINK